MNYVGRKVSQMPMLFHKLTYVVNLPTDHTDGGGGQKFAKSCLCKIANLSVRNFFLLKCILRIDS